MQKGVMTKTGRRKTVSELLVQRMALGAPPLNLVVSWQTGYFKLEKLLSLPSYQKGRKLALVNILQ